MPSKMVIFKTINLQQILYKKTKKFVLRISENNRQN